MTQPRIVHGTRKVRQTRRRGFGYVAYQISQRMQNVSVLVENIPPEQRSQRGSRNSGIADVGDLDNLVLGVSREYRNSESVLRCLPALTASCLSEENRGRVSNEDEISGNSSDSNPELVTISDDRSSTRRDLILKTDPNHL